MGDVRILPNKILSMKQVNLHEDMGNEPTISLIPERDDPLGESPRYKAPPGPPEGVIHENHTGGKFISKYTSGIKNKEASTIYLEQVYYDHHNAFPSHTALKMMRLKKFNFLRKAKFALEKVDALIIGDDPLVSLCTAYSLVRKNNFNVIIVPSSCRLPEGDTEEIQYARIRDLYHEDMIGGLIREYLDFPEHADFSDYDAALFTLTHACQTLNENGPKVMLAHDYTLETDRRDSYQLQDSMDENLTHQLFYAIPNSNVVCAMFRDDWDLIRRELLAHTLPEEAYENDLYITEIVTKLAYVTSPLPLDMEGNVMCQHYRLASGLQSVSQVTRHTDFGYEQRMLDVMSGVGADLFAKEQVTAQDYIQKYINI